MLECGEIGIQVDSGSDVGEKSRKGAARLCVPTETRKRCCRAPFCDRLLQR